MISRFIKYFFSNFLFNVPPTIYLLSYYPTKSGVILYFNCQFTVFKSVHPQILYQLFLLDLLFFVQYQFIPTIKYYVHQFLMSFQRCIIFVFNASKMRELLYYYHRFLNNQTFSKHYLHCGDHLVVPNSLSVKLSSVKLRNLLEKQLRN